MSKGRSRVTHDLCGGCVDANHPARTWTRVNSPGLPQKGRDSRRRLEGEDVGSRSQEEEGPCPVCLPPGFRPPPPGPQTPCFPWRHPLGSSALWHASSLKTEEDFLPRQVVSLLQTLNVFLTMSVTIRFDYHVMGTAQDSRPAVGEFTIRGPRRPGRQRRI